MRPKPIPRPAQGETDMFRNRLDNMIDMRHEFVRLTKLIDWKRFDEAFGDLYAEKGRPGVPTRLMVGLHLLKHARGISDEQVCAQWLENAYFQFFCGETYFQTKLPLERTSMSVWRGRIGADTLDALLAETLAAAMRAKAVDSSQMQRVTVDTTAQTKAIAHPTDSHLLLRAIEWLNKLAKKQGVKLRQSYLRLATRARYEFGVKVSIAVTNARAEGGQFVLGIRAVPGLPYDGHTLKDQIAQVERLTGVAVTRAYVDKGYRGHGIETPDIHVSQSPVKRSPTIKRELRRRCAIEPVIGHAKSEGLLERNHLAGARGDAINAILVGAGHNIRLLLAWPRRFLSFFLALIVSAHSPSTTCERSS